MDSSERRNPLLCLSLSFVQCNEGWAKLAFDGDDNPVAGGNGEVLLRMKSAQSLGATLVRDNCQASETLQVRGLHAVKPGAFLHLKLHTEYQLITNGKATQNSRLERSHGEGWRRKSGRAERGINAEPGSNLPSQLRIEHPQDHANAWCSRACVQCHFQISEVVVRSCDNAARA